MIRCCAGLSVNRIAPKMPLLWLLFSLPKPRHGAFAFAPTLPSCKNFCASSARWPAVPVTATVAPAFIAAATGSSYLDSLDGENNEQDHLRAKDDVEANEKSASTDVPCLEVEVLEPAVVGVAVPPYEQIVDVEVLDGPFATTGSDARQQHQSYGEKEDGENGQQQQQHPTDAPTTSRVQTSASTKDHGSQYDDWASTWNSSRPTHNGGDQAAEGQTSSRVQTSASTNHRGSLYDDWASTWNVNKPTNDCSNQATDGQTSSRVQTSASTNHRGSLYDEWASTWNANRPTNNVGKQKEDGEEQQQYPTDAQRSSRVQTSTSTNRGSQYDEWASTWNANRPTNNVGKQDEYVKNHHAKRAAGTSSYLDQLGRRLSSNDHSNVDLNEKVATKRPTVVPAMSSYLDQLSGPCDDRLPAHNQATAMATPTTGPSYLESLSGPSAVAGATFNVNTARRKKPTAPCMGSNNYLDGLTAAVEAIYAENETVATGQPFGSFIESLKGSRLRSRPPSTTNRVNTTSDDDDDTLSPTVSNPDLWKKTSSSSGKTFDKLASGPPPTAPKKAETAAWYKPTGRPIGSSVEKMKDTSHPPLSNGAFGHRDDATTTATSSQPSVPTTGSYLESLDASPPSGAEINKNGARKELEAPTKMQSFEDNLADDDRQIGPPLDNSSYFDRFASAFASPDDVGTSTEEATNAFLPKNIGDDPNVDRQLGAERVSTRHMSADKKESFNLLRRRLAAGYTRFDSNLKP